MDALYDLGTNGCDGEGNEPSNQILPILQGMNALVDDIPPQPTFHRFLDLPRELRYQIYEQYSHDDKHSITCRCWPLLRFRSLYLSTVIRTNTMNAFLPSLGVCSRSLQTEILPYLLGLATYDLEGLHALTRLTDAVTTIKFVCIADMVRNLKFRNTSRDHDYELFSRMGYYPPSDRFFELKPMSSTMISAMLSLFTSVRQLTLMYDEPLFEKWDPLRPFEDFTSKKDIRRFDQQCVLELVELQQFLVIGKSSFGDNIHNILYKKCNKELYEGDTHSGTTFGRVLETKVGFKAQGRDVVVKIGLLNCRNEDEEIVQTLLS